MKSDGAAEQAAGVLIAAGEPHAAARRERIVDGAVHDRRRDAALGVAAVGEQTAPTAWIRARQRVAQGVARRRVDDLVAVGHESAREAPQRHAGRQGEAVADLAVVHRRPTQTW